MKIISNSKATVFITDIAVRLGTEGYVNIQVAKAMHSNDLPNAILQGLVRIELDDDERGMSGVSSFLSRLEEAENRHTGEVLAERIQESIKRKQVTDDSIPIRPVNFITI